MVIGIIAEGTEDQAVIKNILKGIAKSLNIEIDVRPIRPNLKKDEDDLQNNTQTIGTFQGVKNACEGIDGERENFDKFFFLEDSAFMVIQLDTAEIDNHNFDFSRPNKDNNPNYSIELRNQVIELINGWLENNYENQLLYAIAIEEIEAWCLTIYNKKDTSLSANPKNQLQRILNKRNIKIDGNNIASSFEKKVTKDFKNPKKLKQFTAYNQSLADFVNETIDKIKIIKT
ncbi:MAG: hypothetical protein AB8G11_16815 [Saprospiraceae bacterium]